MIQQSISDISVTRSYDINGQVPLLLSYPVDSLAPSGGCFVFPKDSNIPHQGMVSIFQLRLSDCLHCYHLLSSSSLWDCLWVFWCGILFPFLQAWVQKQHWLVNWVVSPTSVGMVVLWQEAFCYVSPLEGSGVIRVFFIPSILQSSFMNGNLKSWSLCSCSGYPL